MINKINVKLIPNIIVTFCIFTIFFPAISQQSPEDQNLSLNGCVTDEKTGKKLPLVHIFNESSRTTDVTDTGGQFTINVNRGDTLVFSSIGFYYKVVYITDSMLRVGSALITLMPRKYEVPEARVLDLGTYEQFRQKILSLKLPETRTDKLRKSLQKAAREEAMEVEYVRRMDKLTQGGNLLTIPILSPDEKQMLVLKKIKEEEKTKKVIAEKFNRAFIGEITELEGDELTEFMVFCNFSDEYLLDATRYEILIKVLEKLKEFKKLKYSGFNFDFDHQLLC